MITRTEAEALIRNIGAQPVHEQSDDIGQYDDALNFTYRGLTCSAQIDPYTGAVLCWNLYERDDDGCICAVTEFSELPRLVVAAQKERPDDDDAICDEIDGAILNVTVGGKLDTLEIVDFLSRIHVALAWCERVDPSYRLAKEAQRIVDIVGDRRTNAVLPYLRKMLDQQLANG